MIPSAGLPSILQRVTRMLLVMALLWALLMSAVVRQVVHHEVDELMDQSLRESAEILHSVIAVLHQQGRRSMPSTRSIWSGRSSSARPALWSPSRTRRRPRRCC